MKKITNKTKYVSFFLIIAAMIIGSLIQKKEINIKINENYQKFNKSDIYGILLKIRGSGGSMYITVDNKKYVYRRKADDFPYIAEKGDSIIKPAFSDTIILKKPNGKVYKFTFLKPNE